MTSDKRLHFAEPSGYGVTLTTDAISRMLAASDSAGRKETGGILIGRYSADGWHVEVNEATRKPKGSWAGFTWFRRGNNGLAELLRDRWAANCHYVGEWHFHPRSSAVPSKPDLAAMRKSAADPIYDCPIPLLLVLGGHPRTHWEISATLFVPDKPPIFLTPAPPAEAQETEGE